MLVLSRQRDEAIYIGHAIKIVVVDLRGDKVRLGIEAPADCDVHREEVYKAILREGKETIADPLEAALSRVAELEAELASVTAERDKLQAEINLYNSITSADGVFAEQTRRVVATMRAQFDDEWRLKGTGEWRINAIAGGVRALTEHEAANNTATDPAYDEWLKHQPQPDAEGK